MGRTFTNFTIGRTSEPFNMRRTAEAATVSGYEFKNPAGRIVSHRLVSSTTQTKTKA